LRIETVHCLFTVGEFCAILVLEPSLAASNFHVMLAAVPVYKAKMIRIGYQSVETTKELNRPV